VPEGTQKPTIIWPIQKYLWSDLAVCARYSRRANNLLPLCYPAD